MPLRCMSGMSSGAIEPSLGHSPRGALPNRPACCSTASVSCAAASSGQRKRLRKFPSRQAALGKGRIVNQRQDRMEKRRGRQLHLPALLGRAIFPDQRAEDFEVDVEHPLLFLLGEIPPLALQFRQFRDTAAPRCSRTTRD